MAAMLGCLLLLIGVGAVVGSECETVYQGECHDADEHCPSQFHYYSRTYCDSTQLQCCFNHLSETTTTTTTTTSRPTAHGHGETECGRKGGECHDASSQCPSQFHFYTLGICGSSDLQCCFNHVTTTTSQPVHHVTTTTHQPVHHVNTTTAHSTDNECEQLHGGECHPTSNGCPSQFHYYSMNYCGFLQQCCFNHHTATTQSSHVTAPHLPHDESCGLSAVNSQHRIMGGEIALAGEFPWMVSLREGGSHSCGGTLIAPQYVLSAAHCFDSELPADWTAGVGNIHYELMYLYRVVHITRHTGYDRDTMANDIALVKLSRPVDVTGHDVRTACLPHSTSEDFAGEICTVTGWGSGHDENSEYLYKADLPVLTDHQCRYFLGSGSDYTNKELCAGLVQGGKDSCAGDSGGPIVCNKDGVWKLAGIVSWGYECGQPRSPGVYTRVSKYLDWIEAAKNN